MTDEKIKRINLLAKKAKEGSLTEDEKKEQAALRDEYVRAMRASLKSQLDNAYIKNPDGSVLQHIDPVCRRQVIRPETSRIMRGMMEAVVQNGGGRYAQIRGYRVGGKSGTSQKLDSADEKARIASFVAVAPIDDPQFLCLVCLDEPHSWTTAGGSLSAPVCAEVLEQTLVYRGVPRAAESEADAGPAQTAADLPADGDSFDGA